MRRTLPLLFSFCCLLTALSAQVGGLTTWEFLNLSPSARVSALGGYLIAVPDDDVNLAMVNPALLNPSMDGRLSFSHAFHPAGIDQGYASFGLHRPQWWGLTVHGGLQYISYGEMDRADEFGQVNGTFRAAEYALTLGAARTFEQRLTLGANLRLVSSSLESYTSTGGLIDLAARYRDTSGLFNLSLVLRNIGYQFSTYTDGNREPLPFEMLLGVSKRLRHLPFRFSVTYRYLDRWNILYDDPDLQDESIFIGEEVAGRSDFDIWFDNFSRHFVFSGEMLLGRQENFRLRAGYNHLMRRELSVGDFRSLAGFSFGLGVKINRFRIDYGRSTFHLGGGVNHLSIGTSLSEF